MPLVLTDEQQMLRETAAGLLDDKSPVAELRRLRDSRDETGFSRDLWSAFADMGLAGALVPEAHGGVGLGFVEAGVIAEEIGRRLAPSPFLSTAVLGVTALARGGSAAQQAEWLSRFAAGSAIAALAVDEGPKHAPKRTAMTAARAGNGFRLDGDKAFVIDGHAADVLIVAARTGGAVGEEAGLTLFLVDPKARGVGIERTVMVDAHNAARVSFDGVEVDADSVLGEVDDGHGLLEGVLDAGRAVIAAEQTGLGGEAFDRTVSYLKERRQFGRLIGEFQALQHRAAHLYAELEIARAAVLKALQTLDEAPAMAPILVAATKAKAAEASLLAVQEGVQMHGGIGMTDEFEMGFFMKRQRVTTELFGDADFHADRVAAMLGY